MRKNASEVYFELKEKSNKLMLDSIENFYFKKIITPYKISEKIIDMHTHTIYSDGNLSPEELLRLAIDKKIGTISITDHDTIDGIKSLDRNMSIIVDSGINIINGIELSAAATKGRMHILGYGIDLDDEYLNNKMKEIKSNSINSIISIIEQIKRDYNIIFDYEDIRKLINSNSNIGRPDIAKLCVKYGYSISPQEAFDKYLIEAYDKVRKYGIRITKEECTELIIKSGGIPVIAHPKSLELSNKELLIFLKEMITCGLMGIEVYHPSHNKEETEYYSYLANKYNLLISGGSDFHGEIIKPNIELGSGINNNINIKKLSILDKLKSV